MLVDADNLVSLFFAQAAAMGERPFLWRKAGGRWVALSWSEVAQQVAGLAAGLRGIGLEAGDRVVLVAENRPEWCVADLAIMAAGGVTVPAYTSNTVDDHAHVLTDSGARFAIVSTAKLAAPLLAALDGTACRDVIAMEPPGAATAGMALHDWETLVATPATAEACAAAASALGRDDLACIVYTSGTGGRPHGVRQHHGMILHNVAACAAIIVEDFALEEGRFLSVLPLAHAYEHSAGQFLPIGLGAEIWYAEGLDRLAANMAEVRPEVMIVVPRLFEVMRTRIVRAIGQQGRIARGLAEVALRLAAAPRLGPGGRALAWAVGRALGGRVRARFGGRLAALVSGGAPLAPDVGRFFALFGLTILQGYGQTEAGPVISCNRPRAGIRLDTVGPPLDGVTVRIAADGELLVRGANVMHGYWRDETATAAALADGWLHTGDIGHVDAGGRLVITDRKKDMIVNDKGENVAPQRIEGLLTLEPEIGQAIVAGDRRPYLVGLVVPDGDWLAGRDAGDPAVRRGLVAAVDRVNRRLSATERVRRIAIADEPFSIENGELTPSLKARRHMIRRRYGERLDALYRDGAA